MNKKKILIIHPALAPYRIDFFNSLYQHFDAKFYFFNENLLNQKFDQDRLKKSLNFTCNYLKKGINFKISPKLSRYLIKTPTFLLWLSLILILISKNPTLAAYEPFAMFFSLEGAGIQWYILPASLIGSLFISNFFCHYFCPVGASFRWLIEIRRNLINQLKKHNG